MDCLVYYTLDTIHLNLNLSKTCESILKNEISRFSSFKARLLDFFCIPLDTAYMTSGFFVSV